MGELEDEKITGILVDVDLQKGTMTLECEGDFYVCLWTTDFDGEIGDSITVMMDDVLN